MWPSSSSLDRIGTSTLVVKCNYLVKNIKLSSDEAETEDQIEEELEDDSKEEVLYIKCFIMLHLHCNPLVQAVHFGTRDNIYFFNEFASTYNPIYYSTLVYSVLHIHTLKLLFLLHY